MPGFSHFHCLYVAKLTSTLFDHPLPISPSEGLGIANVDYYWYLNQSGTYTVDGTDDKKEFTDTIVS